MNNAPAPQAQTNMAPAPQLNILLTADYFRRHFELCANQNQYDAYDELEAEYEKLAKEKGLEKHYRYKSYESFRYAKTMYYKDNR